MKTTETLVNFILDKSGSMDSVKKATISGFNEYLQTLKKDGNKYSFSLTLFDTMVETPYTNEDIKNVDDLTDKTYLPSGGTALYDAACATIAKVEKKVKKNQKVLTIIMTDGEENSSQEYSEKELKAKIAELEKTSKWSFVFLGANQDSWATAQKFGIAQMNVANFGSNTRGVGASFVTMAANTSAFAGGGSGSTSTFFSAKDQADLNMTTGTVGGSGIGARSTSGTDPRVSAHFSTLGKKSWEARRKKIL